MSNLLVSLRFLNSSQIKFLGVGLLNTLVGYSIYALLIACKLPYLTALFLATILGVIFNYFSVGRLVFSSEGGLAIFAKFVITYSVVYMLNALALNILIATFQLGPYIAQALFVPLSVSLSWILMNCWVFKND